MSLPAPPEAPPTKGAGDPSADPWIAAEPRFAPTTRNVFVRGARHRWRALAAAGALVAMGIAFRTSRPPIYVASLTLRIDEGDSAPTRNAPRPPSRILEYINVVALTRERLLALMERHHLSERLRAANPVQAVASFREDLGFEVIRNSFLLDRQSAGQPRSALVVISYTGGDPELVRVVVHDLAQIVLETQAHGRAARLAQAREANVAQVQRAREQLRSLEQRQARLLSLGARSAGPQAYAELMAVQRDIGHLVARKEDLDRRGSDLDLLWEADRNQLGLTFKVVDEALQTQRRRLGIGTLVIALVVALAVLAPISTIVFGAFDRRLYLASDVLACGYPILGVVPFMPGDDAGSLVARRTGVGKAR